jgi:alanine racemase
LSIYQDDFAMPRPISAQISLAALQHNYELAKAQVPEAKAWAVVKANAYGHGIERAAKALGDRADGFALLDLDEGVRLRDAGIMQPIMLLEGFFQPEDLDVIAEYDFSVVVHCREQVEMLSRSARKPPPAVFVKFNTGMNRLGFVAADLPWLAARWHQLSDKPVTVMTHFADADGPRGVAGQVERFREMIAALGAEGCPLSVSNSAAILRYPELPGAWIRPGIMLYGGSPFGDVSAAGLGLLPAMNLRSEIIAVQTLMRGQQVGYGGRFSATRPMRVGVVACGYADGYPRHAPDGTPIVVDGMRTRIVGRVSMDMITVDLSELPNAGIGSPVVLWGEGLPADEVAASAGTISYELFCALARRVPVVDV